MKRRSRVPIIRANVLAAIVAELARQGVEADHLLREHIETIDILRNPYQEIPLRRFVAFFEAASEMVGDPLLGARIGTHFQAEDLGPLGALFVAATSLKAALDRLGHFLNAWQSGTKADLEVGRNTAEWIYQIEDPEIRPRRQDAEFSLSATCGFIRALLGPRWSPIEVHFEHSMLSHHPRNLTQSLSSVFKAPVLFDQNVNRLIIDKQDLARPVVRAKEAMVPYLERHLHDLMSGNMDADSCSSQVNYLIAKRLGRHPIDIASLAGEMGMSSRTLQRRLADEGTSVRELVQKHRARLSEPLLKSATSITSIAHNMGYADLSVFSRAFKTWLGTNPRSYRRRSARRKRASVR